jgi:hypothetical protein
MKMARRPNQIFLEELLKSALKKPLRHIAAVSKLFR